MRADASRKGSQDEFCRHCLSNAKWPLAGVEVKPGDGYQMPWVWNIFLSWCAEKEKKMSVDLVICSVLSFM